MIKKEITVKENFLYENHIDIVYENSSKAASLSWNNIVRALKFFNVHNTAEFKDDSPSS